MASSTENIKLGVCRAYFDGHDLGLTKGGVEVSVSTETYKVEVDQFGKTPVSEMIMGRNVMARVPMAETTLDNMVRVMPGATLVETGGAAASGTVSIATQPTAAQTVVINGVTFTFRTGTAPLAEDVLIGATAAATVQNLADKLNASTNPKVAVANYTVATTTMTVTYGIKSVEGNTFTLAAGTSGATVSGATLSGGTNPTARRVDVTTGVEQPSLINLARELRLHPVSKADEDKSEDFIIPLAATAGALTFAYQVEAERIFNVEFTGYPDPTTQRLFIFGTPE
jgi:hypothetical protein